jgi:hypothetical protein
MAMSLEETIQTLNRFRHRDSSRWHVVPNLRKPYLRESPSVTPAAWLTPFEAEAIAEKYLRDERGQSEPEDAVTELLVFLCRGGGVELPGVRPSRGDRGDMIPMLAGDERRVAELREVAREQVRAGIMSAYRLCRFVNAETVEVIE